MFSVGCAGVQGVGWLDRTSKFFFSGGRGGLGKFKGTVHDWGYVVV